MHKKIKDSHIVVRLVKVDIVLWIYSGVRYSPCVHTWMGCVRCEI